MSTNDVPGAVAAHHDELHMGCWAEHEDGSLIFVESTEGGRVVFSVFDIAPTQKTPPEPVIEYRDAMPMDGFKQKFSWSKGRVAGVKWTWHDKTPFPWDRIMGQTSAGPRYASAQDQLSAAEKVAQSLGLTGRPMTDDEYRHLRERVGKAGRAIWDGIQDALKGIRTK